MFKHFNQRFSQFKNNFIRFSRLDEVDFAFLSYLIFNFNVLYRVKYLATIVNTVEAT
jgi:hypothetical protein